MAMRRLIAYGAIYFLWGGSFLAIRQLVAIAPPFFCAGVRFLIAGLLLYAYGSLRGAPSPSRRQWMSTALLGLVMFAGNYACLFWSEKFLPSGLAAVISSLIPVWVLLAEWLLFHSAAATAKAVWGIILGVAGVVLIALPSGVNGMGLTKAAAILVLGTLFWAAGTVASSRLSLPKQLTISASLQMAWGGSFLLVLSAVAGEAPGVGRLAHLWNWRLTLSMAYLIVAASIVAFSAYVWLIGKEPATRVASYAYVNPLIALLLGAVLAHERPAWLQYAGAMLVLAGVFSTLAGRRAIEHPPIERPKLEASA